MTKQKLPITVKRNILLFASSMSLLFHILLLEVNINGKVTEKVKKYVFQKIIAVYSKWHSGHL